MHVKVRSRRLRQILTRQWLRGGDLAQKDENQRRGKQEKEPACSTMEIHQRAAS